ncbi:hypothetical protein BKA82DRAFT_997796 [Pisolithus tinctorius]|uniref:DUF7918 domain-containing protein n=1 Tax=Pisolithus tinctorius Marx 270 TaxID=870435 RepID=A0A0C3PGU9_PISTI|nr:hypothetical protein BKA82DRAFT_997796 [Pisolithus tinctorius]KIO07621.1 hypothetical protein M404DRAFT_997796 [Pisolithus tinctorius Marx 270]
MRLGDFSAHVVVEGKELEEYEVTISNGGKQVTCWIASEAGKKFSVTWECHSMKRLDSRGELTVDSIICSCLILSKGRNHRGDFSTLHLGTKERDLMFCDLQLTDDEALLGKSVSNQLGEITLRIYRGRINRENIKKGTLGTDSGLTTDANVYHEKSVKKLTTHCVGFGPERESRVYNLVDFTPNRSPPLEFVFKYRPIGILQANGIAPRPTPVIPTDTLSGNSSGTQTETQSVVLERIIHLENELKRLRSQVSDGVEDQKPKRIKREHTETHPVVHGEVIDLT